MKSTHRPNKIRSNTYQVERTYTGKQTLESLVQRLLLAQLVKLEKDWTSKAK